MELLKLIKKSWTDKYIYFWVALVMGVPNVVSILKFDWRSKKFCVVCGIFLICYIVICCIVHSKRDYPKFSKDSYGILFAIDVENDEQYNLINKKFVTPFRNHCVNKLGNVETQMLKSS